MHEIEQFTSGAAFVSARQHAWHRLGTVLPAEFDAAAAMRHAHLGGWDVRKASLHTAVLSDDGVSQLEVPERYATVRTHPETGRPEVLGVVGEQYRPIQNEDHADLLDLLVDESGAHFETAGSLRGGRQVFVTMKVPSTMLIGGVDPVDLYLVACNSHDGSSAFRLLVTPVRVVCANTQAAAIRSARSSFAIRHTASAAGRIAEARQALGLTFRYAQAFQTAADSMIAQSMSTSEFEDLVTELWPVSATASPRTRTVARSRAWELRQLFTGSDTNTTIRGTRWAAYQAITEYTDHTAPVPARVRDRETARATRVLTSASIVATKVRAFDLLTV